MHTVTPVDAFVYFAHVYIKIRASGFSARGNLFTGKENSIGSKEEPLTKKHCNCAAPQFHAFPNSVCRWNSKELLDCMRKDTEDPNGYKTNLSARKCVRMAGRRGYTNVLFRKANSCSKAGLRDNCELRD